MQTFTFEYNNGSSDRVDIITEDRDEAVNAAIRYFKIRWPGLRVSDITFTKSVSVTPVEYQKLIYTSPFAHSDYTDDEILRIFAEYDKKIGDNTHTIWFDKNKPAVCIDCTDQADYAKMQKLFDHEIIWPY